MSEAVILERKRAVVVYLYSQMFKADGSWISTAPDVPETENDEREMMYE